MLAPRFLATPTSPSHASPAQTGARVSTERLELRCLGEAFLSATIEGHAKRAEALLDCRIPRAWFAEALLASLNLEELRADPTALPWLVRGVVHRATNEMVGHIGFHSRPAPASLHQPPASVELGYEIFEEHRRQGYAEESIRGLLSWAHRTHHQSGFLVAVVPSNEPSRSLARKLGFVPAGRRKREASEEDLFELKMDSCGRPALKR
jgi:[ribosomal protein S5]-alanine N-acetyltransferase